MTDRFDTVHGGAGKTCDARYAHLWAVKDHKITTWRQGVDTLAVAQARV